MKAIWTLSNDMSCADLPAKSKKRAVRDAKFGFGGRKKLAKQNNAESSADMNALARDSRKSVGGKFSGSKPGKGGKMGGRGKSGPGVKNAGVKKRPGKNARQQSKGKGGR